VVRATRSSAGGETIEHDGRLYSDKEVALILRKATDLQQQSGSETGDGLSLPVLADIAREIGVEPKFVKQAAAALEDRSAARAALWGGPTLYASHLASSRKLSRDEMLRLVDRVRGVTQRQGGVQEVLGAVEWKTSGQPSELAVTITPGGDVTRVRMMGDRGGAAALTWGLSVAGGLAAGGIAGAILEPATVLGGIGVMTATVTAGLGLARALWGRSTQKFEARFAQLREELSRYLAVQSDGR